jgi:hypothetical protein
MVNSESAKEIMKQVKDLQTACDKNKVPIMLCVCTDDDEGPYIAVSGWDDCIECMFSTLISHKKIIAGRENPSPKNDKPEKKLN